MHKKPVAIVIQRFGPSIIGGAESYAADLAVQIKRHLNREVHVFTTCAESNLTWENVLSPGLEITTFGAVHRFPTKFKRWRPFGILSRCLIFARSILIALRAPDRFIKLLETIWFVAQGPFSPGLIETLKSQQHEYACVLAVTYLYWPTLAAIEQLEIRKVLLPLAHDETPFYFDRVKRCLHLADAVVSNIEPEQTLITKVSGRSDIKVVGAGINHRLPIERKAEA